MPAVLDVPHKFKMHFIMVDENRTILNFDLFKARRGKKPHRTSIPLEYLGPELGLPTSDGVNKPSNLGGVGI